MRRWNEKRARRAARPVSPAEQRILDILLESGASNEAIAKKLGLNWSTVKVQMRVIMDKTGFHDRTELAVNLLHQEYRKKLRLATTHHSAAIAKIKKLVEGL